MVPSLMASKAKIIVKMIKTLFYVVKKEIYKKIKTAI